MKIKKGKMGHKNNLLQDKISHSSRRGKREREKKGQGKIQLKRCGNSASGYVCVSIY
jgi:hypothetical protein